MNGYLFLQLIQLLNGESFGFWYKGQVKSLTLGATSKWIKYNGTTDTVTATVNMVNSQATKPSITWKSLNTKVCTVSYSGDGTSVTLKTVREGTATIQVTADDETTTLTVYSWNVYLNRQL